ncbi:hypothetical protein STP03_059 [Salmonella phage STP03]|uniref:Uncharacterized protein n=1 Tax=Salmonella phage STP03 TaxID=1914788 RepID=A0A1U9HYR5_9CAUD|nr:hypothetical protein QA065_gp57 [Salmonella phage STP03]APM00313.1 hypothetical protein STP03_059 [Salmonella phage STP03]
MVVGPQGAAECIRFVDEATIDFYDSTGNWPYDCQEIYGGIASAIVRKPSVPLDSEVVYYEDYKNALNKQENK